MVNPSESAPGISIPGVFIIFGHSIYLMEIGAEKIFQKDSGDGTPCVTCKEPIFGYRYILIYAVLGESLESKIQLCESCYELLKVEPTRR